jgi:putative membrane protein (TIGR04086 family)
MARSSLSAFPIVFGTAVDLGITFLAGLVLSSGSIVAALSSTDPAEAERLTNNVFRDPTLAAAMSAGATLGTLVGGFTAARLAHARPVAHGLGVGLLGVAPALLDLAAGGDFGLPAPFPYVLLAAALPAAALGGLLGSGTR